MSQDASTPSADSATSLADFLDDSNFSSTNTGNTVDFAEPPSPSSTSEAAGAPPAEPSGEPGETPVSPTGAEPSSVTPVDPNAPPAQPIDDDPFKDATPLGYTVNGEARTFEEIKVLPGIGAVIDAAALPKLQQRLQERDHLFERSQQAYQERQALDKLMAWTEKGPDGKDVALSGPQALEAQRVLLGRTLANLDVLSSALNDPAQLASLVRVDEQGNFSLNQSAVRSLLTTAENAEMKAERAVRAHWATLHTPTPAQPANTAPQVNPQAVAQHYATQLGKGVLTDTDVQFLSGHVERYIRPATQEEVRQGVAGANELVIDPAFEAMVQDRAELRKATATAVSTATTVANENATKLRAALLPNGKPAQSPNTRPTQQPQRQPNRQSTTDADRDALFLNMERSIAATM